MNSLDNSGSRHDELSAEKFNSIIAEKEALIKKLFTELEEAKHGISLRDREIDQLRSVLIQKNIYIDDNKEVPMERSKKRGVIGERLDVEKNFENPPEIIEKDLETISQIKEALLQNEFLRRLEMSEIDDIIKYMKNVSFEPQSYIIEEGQDGDAFYVSLEGRFEVWKDKSLLGTMESSRAFGELALLYNCKRTASVKAINECKIWKLDRKTFQFIMFTSTVRKQREIISFLKTIPALRDISAKKITKLADVVEEIRYQPNDYIIRENEVGNAFFIIKSGEVRVTQTNSEGVEEHVRNMTKGEWFGEKALYTLERRSANIIALGQVELLSLDRNNFIYLIGHLTEIRKKKYNDSNSSSANGGDYQTIQSTEDELRNISLEDSQTRKTISRAQLNDSERWIESVKHDDLKTVGILGIGGFGRVELVQYCLDEDKIFALKCMKKDHIVRTKQQQHIIAERDIMIEIKCNFVCRLYKTFRDDKYVYMLIEACLGGELWTILRNRGNFDDNITRFVIACVLEAFTFLHLKGILYRDLKPENLLIDKTGYIKMCDFGFAKKVGVGNKTWTFCGTPEYVAPEIILNKGHDHSADYWSLGILMYELLTGSPPFTGVDPMKIYNVILRGIEAVDFPPTNISRNAGHLIKKLCVQSPVERLGYGRGGIVDIKQNKYFQGFDWIGLHRGTLVSPMIPKIKNKTDLSNFDVFQFVNEVPPDECSGWDKDF